MAIVTVAIDLAKSVFAVHAVDVTGKPALVRPEGPRAKLLELIAHLAPCVIGMEACSGSHQWAQPQWIGAQPMRARIIRPTKKQNCFQVHRHLIQRARPRTGSDRGKPDLTLYSSSGPGCGTRLIMTETPALRWMAARLQSRCSVPSGV